MYFCWWLVIRFILATNLNVKATYGSMGSNIWFIYPSKLYIPAKWKMKNEKWEKLINQKVGKLLNGKLSLNSKNFYFLKYLFYFIFFILHMKFHFINEKWVFVFEHRHTKKEINKLKRVVLFANIIWRIFEPFWYRIFCVVLCSIHLFRMIFRFS